MHSFTDWCKVNRAMTADPVLTVGDRRNRGSGVWWRHKWKMKIHADILTAVLRCLHCFIFLFCFNVLQMAGGSFRGYAKGVRLGCPSHWDPTQRDCERERQTTAIWQNRGLLVCSNWRWTRKIWHNEKASLKDALWFIRVGKLESTWQIPLISSDFHQRFWTP